MSTTTTRQNSKSSVRLFDLTPLESFSGLNLPTNGEIIFIFINISEFWVLDFSIHERNKQLKCYSCEVQEHEEKKTFECSICNVNLMVYSPFKIFLTLQNCNSWKKETTLMLILLSPRA